MVSLLKCAFRWKWALILGGKRRIFYQTPSPLLCFAAKSLFHTHTHRQMEGIIPFVYRIIIQHRSAAAGQSTMADSWFSESPTLPYMRLPGDSGYMGLLPEPTNSPLSTSRHMASTGCLSALCFSTSRYAFSWQEMSWAQNWL